MKLSAILMVRNEESVIRVNLAYHRSIGVTEFWVIDNGSTDGTARILEDETKRHGDVRWRGEPGLLHQGDAITAVAAEAILAGADWILPTDADEFWWTASGSLSDELSNVGGAGAIICSVDNFVQHRSVLRDSTLSLFSMQYRAIPIGTEPEARHLVENGEIAFVEMVYPPKQILRATPGLVVGMGNHTADNLAGSPAQSTAIRMFHAPIRARDILEKRAEIGRRRAATYPSLNASWHQRRWTRMAEDEILESDWLANSQEHGYLQVGRGRHALAWDPRLQNAVAPFAGR